MLKIKGLKKRLGDFVLGPINLSAKKGVTVILGPNGAGKTTLLNLIAGLDEPDSGSIKFDGKELIGIPVEKRKMGYIFQNDTLFPHLDVQENIRFGLGKADSTNNKRYKSVVGLMGISHLEDRMIDQLSQGERQRVSIARTLVTDPDILMLDEPLSSLDRPFRVDLRQELNGLLHDLGKIVLYVTHFRNDVHYLADNLSILEKGRMTQFGDPQSIMNMPKSLFTARFSGYHNILKGKVEEDEDGLVTIDVRGVKVQAVTETYRKGMVSVCIRPEDVLISKFKVEGSPRNSIHGHIVNLVQKGPLAEILFESKEGIMLNALITQRSANELDLEKGKEIWATFKTVSARVLKD